MSNFRLLCVICCLGLISSVQAEYRILAFGDSNTWGWKPDGSGTRYGDTQRWAGVLQTKLGSDYTVLVDGMVARRTDLDGVDSGPITGDQLNGAKALPVAISRNAPVDLVIIFLGTNDLQKGAERSAEETASAVAGLAKLAKNCGNLLYSSYAAPADVWIVAPPAFGDLAESPLQWLFEVGVEESGNLQPAFEAMSVTEGFRIFYLDQIISEPTGPDGIHLTLSAHLALGTAIAEAVQEQKP